MNYYGARELAESFRTVRKNTVTIAQEIGEEHYAFRVTPDTKSIAEILVHIGLVPRLSEQIHRIEHRTSMQGFDFLAFRATLVAEEKSFQGKAQIIDLLRNAGDDFSTWMEGLSDEFLGERVTLPPGVTPATKTRFEMLLGVKEHEMHHRGQLMVMERMLGMVPHMTREFQARMAAMAGAKQ
jgi:uncharacterized damage-inducible protein DinB